MRLIDSDALQEVITQDWFLDILLTQTSKYDMAKKLVDMIDSVPLAYDVEKVVEELEMLSTEVKMILPFSKEAIETKEIASGDAIEIIRRGGVK